MSNASRKTERKFFIMKLTKRILTCAMAIVLVAAMALSFTACGGDKAVEDVKKVKDAGKIIVGITEYAPMDYKDENGEWTGFDAEFARLFAAELGVAVEFVEIDWDNKILELDAKSIDCVWNGMTLTDEVKAAMETSNAYCNNQQIVIVKKDVADSYTTVDSVKALNFAVYKGSAGQKEAAAIGAQYKEVVDQATALAEIKSGKRDIELLDEVIYEQQTHVKRKKEITGTIKSVIFFTFIGVITPIFIFSILSHKMHIVNTFFPQFVQNIKKMCSKMLKKFSTSNNIVEN